MEQDRSPADFLRTLGQAEAKTAAASWPAAATLWTEVVAANPVEGRFWSALGTARYETKDFAGAITAFRRALALGDGYPAEAIYHIARCHAAGGEGAAALDRLEESLAMGYRDLERARTDRAFAGLRDSPRYRDLVALIETEGMTRDEGWRTDLRFLSREIKRRAYDPFRHIAEAAFDGVVAGIDERLPELTDLQVIVEIERLLRTLGDGHAWITPDPDDERWQHSLPVQFFLFGEDLLIVASAPEHETLLGARVLHFDGRPVAEVIAALDQLLPRDNGNEQWPRRLMSWRLRQLPVLHALGVADDPHHVTLTVRDRPEGAAAGAPRSIQLATDTSRPATRDEHRWPYPAGWTFFPATLPGPLPLYLRHLTAPYWYTYLDQERTVYFQFNSVRDAPGERSETLAEFCERLFAVIAEGAVERLVIDLRWNGGGNTFLEIQLLQRLIASRVNRRGRLFVIIGRGTFSAAQNAAGMFDRYTDAIFVGEPTGSSPTFVGESVPFRLPYSTAEVNVSDLLWQSTWPMDYRIWIAPTLYTPPTLSAYRANRDPALEAILAWREHLPGW